ncbi:MAG TPA: HAMP domain-containing sensor histidine kinase [Gaiellaceae bacterium]
MSFRSRITALVAVAIAVTVASTAGAVWVISKHELYHQLDQTLVQQVEDSGRGLFGRANNWTLIIAPDGSRSGQLAIPVTPHAAQVAAGSSQQGYYASVTIQNERWRELVEPITTAGGAFVTIYPLEPTQHALARIQFWIFLLGAIGIAVAAALASLVATATLRPVRRLTAAAETVAATGVLTARVDVDGTDEIGRLATRFNAMLAALEESVGRQRRLVADASHELRTPLTAARANVDLVREGKLAQDEAHRALDEAAIELGALTTLLADLVELARGEERKLRIEEVHLDDLVAAAVERAHARAPEATFVTALSPSVVKADPVLLERAVGNLLDNAVKYSPAGAPIEVNVRNGEVVVADHGPGVAEEDLPRIFDRFYRAASARSKPGAGLGLAIVREAAEAHGGTATVESGATGARFKLTLPAAV